MVVLVLVVVVMDVGSCANDGTGGISWNVGMVVWYWHCYWYC